MSDQIVPNITTPAPAQTATTTATTQDKTGVERTYTAVELEQIVKDRLERATVKAQEAERKATEKATTEAAAKQGDWQKLAEQREKEAGELKARLDALETASRKRAIGAKYNLPDELAARLMGATDDELEADAKKLQALIPAVPKPSPGPVNPGASASTVGESATQKLQRIHGTTADAWNTDAFRKQGGGVISREE
jgi:hypothetical protein